MPRPSLEKLAEYPHTGKSEESWANVSGIHSKDGKLLGTEGVGESFATISEEEEFRRKYEEIWGISKQKKRSSEKNTLSPNRISELRPGLRPFKIRRLVFMRKITEERPRSFEIRRGFFRRKLEKGKEKLSPPLQFKARSVLSETEKSTEMLSSTLEFPAKPVLFEGREKNEDISLSLELKVRHVLSENKAMLSPTLKRAMLRHSTKKMQERRRRLHDHNQHQVMLYKIPRVRTKFARWNFAQASKSSFPSGVWHRRFAMLNLPYENFMRGRRLPKLIALSRDKFFVAFKDELVSSNALVSIRKFWDTIPTVKRIHMWPELILTALRRHPEKALEVLSAIYTEPYPPSYAISDTLDFIISHYLRNRETPMTDIALMLWRDIDHLLHNGPKDHIHLSQSSLYLLISHLDVPTIKTLYKTLDKLGHPLHQNTLIHFASRLAKSGDKGYALELLERMSQYEFDFNTPKMLSLCTSILQRKDAQAGKSDSEVFGSLLQCGMKPNIIIYNVLLSNSLQAGDHETGWKIHDMMIENGIEADSYTYSILLNDAKLRIDPSAIRQVMSLVTEKGIRGPHIITDVLHAIFLLHRQQYWVYDPSSDYQDQPPEIFVKMLRVYCDFFHLEPLIRLVPGFTERYPDFSLSNTAPLVTEHLMDPPMPTLVVMLTGFLNGLTESQTAMGFYSNFRKLVLAGDPSVTELTQTTHIYNLVLMTFGRFSDRLVDCPNVIADMLSPTWKTTAIADNHSLIQTSKSDNQAVPPFESTEKVARDGNSCGTSNRESAGATDLPDTDCSSSEPVSEFESHESSLQLQKSARAARTEEQSQRSGPRIILYDHLITWRPITLSAPSRKSSVNDQAPASSHHALMKPDVYTWSILLKIFMDHHQPRAAEKVLKMMIERGVAPNQVTWNSLACGYARMQDPTMTVDAIERLEQAGFEIDGHTMKGLEWIQNRRALIAAMKAKNRKSLTTRSAGEGIFLNRLKKALNGKLLNPKKEERIDNVETGAAKCNASVAEALGI